MPLATYEGMFEPRRLKTELTSPSKSLSMSLLCLAVLEGWYSTGDGVMVGSRGATGVAATNAHSDAGSNRLRRVNVYIGRLRDVGRRGKCWREACLQEGTGESVLVVNLLSGDVTLVACKQGTAKLSI